MENPYQPPPTLNAKPLARTRNGSEFVLVALVAMCYCCVGGEVLSFTNPAIGRFIILPSFLFGLGVSVWIVVRKRTSTWLRAIALLGALLNSLIGGSTLILYAIGIWFWSTFQGPG